MMSVRHLLAGMGGRSSAVDVALLLLRVFAGVAFVLHGWGKVADVSGFAAEQGVPVVLGAAAAYVQFIGGLLLVVGLLTPLAAFGIGVTMVVAVVMLVRAGESFINPGGHSWESAALYAVLMLCLMMLGAGRYSLDAMLFTRDPVADRAASSISRGAAVNRDQRYRKDKATFHTSQAYPLEASSTLPATTSTTGSPPPARPWSTGRLGPGVSLALGDGQQTPVARRGRHADREPARRPGAGRGDDAGAAVIRAPATGRGLVGTVRPGAPDAVVRCHQVRAAQRGPCGVALPRR